MTTYLFYKNKIKKVKMKGKEVNKANIKTLKSD